MHNRKYLRNIGRDCLFAITALAITLGAAPWCLARSYQQTEQDLGLTLSLSVIEQFETDVGQSRFEVFRTLFKAEKSLVKSRNLISQILGSYLSF